MSTKRVECLPNCHFVVESDSIEEIEQILIRHSKRTHHMTLKTRDIYEMMHVVPTEIEEGYI